MQPCGCWPIPCVPSTSALRTWGSTAGEQGLFCRPCCVQVVGNVILTSSRERCGCTLPSQTRAVCPAWMWEMRSKHRGGGLQPKQPLLKTSSSAAQKPDVPYVLSCEFRPQAGSPMPRKDKVAMWSLPAWPNPPSLLHHICTTPHNLMQCLSLSDQLPRSPLNSNFIFYWDWDREGLVCLPIGLGAPSSIYSGKSFRASVPAQCCVPVCSHQIGGLPRAGPLCPPSDRGFLK